MTGTVSLSSMQLIINGQPPAEELLKRVFEEKIITYNNDDELHKIECDIINDNYYWLYSNYGKIQPRSDIIIDKLNLKEIGNPRQIHQAEPNKQLFILYDANRNVLYISNIKKTKFIKSFIEKQLNYNHEIIIKNIYKPIDEFIDILKDVNEITFTSHNNLFSSSGDITKLKEDFFGHDSPDELTISAKYNNVFIQKLINTIKKIYKRSENLEIEGLVIKGRDENGFDTVFNISSFIKKINVLCNKNENDMYNQTEIKEKIINNL